MEGGLAIPARDDGDGRAEFARPPGWVTQLRQTSRRALRKARSGQTAHDDRLPANAWGRCDPPPEQMTYFCAKPINPE